MKRVSGWGLFATVALSAMFVPAAAGNITVGRFYMEIAQAKHLVAVDAAAAEANLRAAGFEVPELTLDKSLTEGDMTSISNALGLAVTTHRPLQPISETQLNTFMASFGRQLGASRARAVDPDQLYSQGGDPGSSGNGKGKKKGHHKSDSEPD